MMNFILIFLESAAPQKNNKLNCLVEGMSAFTKAEFKAQVKSYQVTNGDIYYLYSVKD